MRFEESSHWSDGQFLQPHHFQYFQRRHIEELRNTRSLILAYPRGLIDFEIDRDALGGGRVVIKRFSAIMGDGTPLSMPGNCLLSPLNLEDVLKQNPNEITVYIAIPYWSEFGANMAKDGKTTEKLLFIPEKKQIRDENTGDNEITLIARRLNVRLTTDLDDNKDIELLPVLKLNVLSHDKTEYALGVNEKYFPPFVVLNPASPLYGIIQGLIVDIHRCRDKAQDILITSKFINDNLSGYNAYTLLRLKTLNVYENRLSSLLAVGNSTPFDFYLELSSLLSELMTWDPVNSVNGIPRYDHDDSAPQFLQIIKDIRSFILREGGADYLRFDFKPIENGRYLFTALKPEDIYRAQSAYLALICSIPTDRVIQTVEEGDTFKLINPQSKQLRIRGVKLKEVQYPPRFLPVLDKVIWFKLDLEESARVWREIIDEQGIAVDYVAEMFPALELSLFFTIG